MSETKTVTRSTAEQNGSAGGAGEMPAAGRAERTGRGRRGSRGLSRPVGRPVLGVLLMVVGAAVAAAVYAGSTDERSVLVAARNIQAGHVIDRADLRVGEFTGDGDVAVVDAGASSSVLGRVAVGPIPAGTVLGAGMVSADPAPGTGLAAVGLMLKPGQMPAELAAGRSVDVLLVSAAGSQDDGSGEATPAAKVLSAAAEVVSVEADPSGSWLVTVTVPQARAVGVSGAAAAGRVALVMLPVGAS